MKIAGAMEWKGLFTGELSWVGQVFLVVLVVLMLNYLFKRALKRLQGKLTATENPWDDAVVDALVKPARWLVWIVGIAFAARIIQRETEAAAVFEAVRPLRDGAVIVLIAWFLMRLVVRVEENLLAAREAAGKKTDRTTADALAKIVRASIIISSVLVILQTLGFSISGVLAFGGIGGVAVGFAAKDLLSNLLGGMILFFDRPFVVGDWILSPDREIEGTVEEIGWRQTRIRTFDKRPLYVPNGLFLSMTIENPSRMTHRRIRETIGIRYDDVHKMGAITVAVRQMLVDHPEIDESQTLMVHFNAFAPSSIDFFIYTFTHTTVWTEFHRVKQDVLLKVTEIIASQGAEIAFPTSTLHVPEGVEVTSPGPPPAS